MIRVMRSLGEHMKARREQLALSQNRAAKIANASRTTWINWETDKASPERFNYVRIETVLDWEPGSVEAIQQGRDPVARRKEHGPPPVPEGVLIDPADWAIMTPDERATYVRIVTGVRRRRQRSAPSA
jgi:DNA-binding XRE family transcriptional regulator